MTLRIKTITIFFLSSLFILSSYIQTSSQVLYDCYEKTGKIPALCNGPYDSYSPKYNGTYYKCDGSGGYEATNVGVSIECMSGGYRDTPAGVVFDCYQKPPPVTGYTYDDIINGVCGVKGPPVCVKHSKCYTNSECDSNNLCEGDPKKITGWYCSSNLRECCNTNDDIGCFARPGGCNNKNCPSLAPTVYRCSCTPGGYPGSGAGRTLFDGQCCYGAGGGGGGGGCVPKCPEQKCTVSDNCKDTNRPFDPEYMFYRMTEEGGELCKGQDAYCSQDNGCGGENICNTASCYKPETNNSIPKVNRIQIFEDLGIKVPNQTKNFYWASPDSIPAEETLIRDRHPNSSTGTEVDNIGLPTGARGLRARLRIKGTTVSNETEVSGSPKELGRDNPFYAFRNIPDKGWSWFNYGYSAYFSATFETQNKCDDSWIPGQSSKLHFKVNTPPVLTSTTITGDTVKTEKGCTPENRYTGNEANRKLTFNIAARDIDVGSSNPNHKINAAIIWLVKEGHSLGDEINNIRSLGPRDTHVALDPNKIGLIVYTTGTHVGLFRYYPTDGWVRKNGGTAQDQQSIYINNNGSNVKIAEVKAVRMAQNGNTTHMEIDIEFEKNSPISGKYTLWAGMMDNLTLFEAQPYGIFTDQRSVKRTGETWNFDFVNPKLQDISLKPKSPEDQRRLDLKWNSTDNIPNGIRPNHTVVNVYKTGTTPAHPVIREAPSPQQTVQNPHSGEQIPPQEDIGKMQTVTNSMPNSGWFHPNAGQTEMTANVGTNSEGKIHFYITTYDRACNYTQTGKDDTPGIEPTELNKWITTKGGVFYSQGTVSYPTDGLDQKHNLGTELISSRTGGLYKVLDYAETNMNPAVAKRITDVNNNAGLFDKLKENFERIKPTLPKVERTPTTPVKFFCRNPKGCIAQEARGINTGGFEYSGKIILIPSEGEKDINLTYYGDIKQLDDNSALFVFAEGDITIKTRLGSSSSATQLETDQIDAFLITKGQVRVQRESEEEGEPDDKLIVNGGVIAFGEGGASPAFSLRRTLGLLNISNPVLTVNYHPKYAVASELFFGLQVNAYKREVGFKPM